MRSKVLILRSDSTNRDNIWIERSIERLKLRYKRSSFLSKIHFLRKNFKFCGQNLHIFLKLRLKIEFCYACFWVNIAATAWITSGYRLASWLAPATFVKLGSSAPLRKKLSHLFSGVIWKLLSKLRFDKDTKINIIYIYEL